MAYGTERGLDHKPECPAGGMNIVLLEPEMPANTGNIGRTCVATGSRLHLIEPLGFRLNEKMLRRAGLDYWPFVKLEVHESLEEFLHSYEGRRMYLATTKGVHRHTDVQFQDEDMILFGRETKGLPKDFIAKHQENTLRIPMSADTRLRSLNLANSVNIVLFEALRQLDFPGLE